MDRFIIDAYGADDDALRDAVVWLVKYAEEHGLNEATIGVPGVRNIDGLAGVIGRDTAAFAEKNRYFTVDAVRVNVVTPRTQPYSVDGPVLVPWADTKMVLDAERLRPPAICATGWSEDGLDDWKRSYGPTDPRTNQAEEIEEAPAAVRGAVKRLSGPLGNDVVHPMDRRRAIDVFKALRICGLTIDAALVRGLAIRHGWDGDAADRLQEIAAKVAAGSPLRGGSQMNKTEAKRRVASFEADPD